MSLTDRIVDGFKATFAARIVNNVANGLLLLLLARFLLTNDQYGLLFTVISIVAIAQLGADLGLARSAARYVSERKETDPSVVPYLLRTSLGYRLALLALVSGLLVAVREPLAAALEMPELASLLVLGAGYLVFQSLCSYHMSLFQGFNRVDLSAVVEVVNNVARLVFVVALTALGLGVAGALLGYVAGVFLATVIGLYLLYRRFYIRYDDGGGNRSLRNRMLRYSVPLTATHGANLLDRQVDTVLVAFFLNPVAVSYYVLSKQISEFVLVPAASLGFSVSPTYGEEKATASLDRAARIYETTLEYMFVLYVPAAVGIVLVAEPAVTLIFGTGFAGAAPVLQVLSVYVLFQAVTDVTTQGLDYLGRAKTRAYAKGATSVGNVALNLVLIPSYGVVGAAAATVFTFGIYTVTNVAIMHSELSLDLSRLSRVLALASVLSAGMGVAVLALVPYASSLPSLVGVILAGALIWGVLVTATGMVDPRETIARLT